MGLAESLPRRLYERTGPRYFDWLVASMMLAASLVVAFGIATTAFYIDGSLGEYAVLTAAALFWYVAEASIAAAILYRAGAGVLAWLDGARGEEAALAAWCDGASLPARLARRPLPYVVGAVAPASWGILTAVLLDLPWLAAAAVWPAAFGLYAYWVIARTLVIELTMRPVLEEVTPHLPADAELDAPRIGLRTRLLATLPALCWGTGGIVGGVTSRLGEGAGTLAIASGVAVVATLVGSIWLILVLADSVTGPVASLHQATRRVGQGELDVRAPVVSTDETGDLTRSFNDMVSGLRDRERLRDAFGKFVDPALTERVLREGVDLRGEEVVVSVLFVDVRDFTAMSESASAQQAVARLNELYEEVVPAILEHGGHANKFIGDGLLAVFGAPQRLPDHADRATAAGLDIAERVQRRFGGELRVGVGVNSGPVLAGTIGGGGRLDFTVIGDTVNTAARVEAATRATGDDVLVTDATVELLRREDVALEERPSVPLKGKTAEVRLFAARRRASADPAPRPGPAATARRGA